MHLWSSTLFVTFLYAIQISSAIRISLPRHPELLLSSLSRRVAPDGTSGDLDFNGTAYTLAITSGTQSFKVMADTGSSDLWVAGTVPNAKPMGYNATLTYSIGIYEGPVKTANFTIDGHTVTDQVFVEMVPGGGLLEGTGFFGLGPSNGSVIRNQANSSAADSPIPRILQNGDPTKNFITLQLARPNDTRDNYTNELTIGEILPQYQNITNRPKVPVVILPPLLSPAQYFSVHLDPNGITGPDGKQIPTTSNITLVPNDDKRRLHLLLDSGFTLPQFPEYIVDAIYSGIKGARLVDPPGGSKIYKIPCDAEVSQVKLLIAGQSFPLHPLDLSQQLLGETDDNGKPVCSGAIQPADIGQLGQLYDGIVGMAILRNMYGLFNFGNLTEGRTGDPFVQLIPTTDPEKAHADFVTQRLNGKHDSFWQKYKVLIIAGSIVAGVAALAGVVRLAVRRRKLAYRPLNEPAPTGDVAMESITGYNAGAQYADPWTHRS